VRDKMKLSQMHMLGGGTAMIEKIMNNARDCPGNGVSGPTRRA
jgi:hypothetical protein